MADVRSCPVLRAEPVTTVPEVIERLAAIRDATRAVAPECGVGCFSDLYLTITQGIWKHIQAGNFFVDNEYLERLDVVFASRYFDALRAWAAGGKVPKAWQVLFDAPVDGAIGAIGAARLAGAGVNAHINLDLAVATVDTGREMGDSQLEKGVRERSVQVSRQDDYDKINPIFAEHMDELLDRLKVEPDADPEHLSALGRLMTRIVTTARLFAWKDAQDLWPLPRRSDAWDAKEQQMDAVAYLVGRSLLIDLTG